LQQVRVNEHAQLLCVTERWNTTSGFGNPSSRINQALPNLIV
jgi:hypothetical protein